MDSTWYRSGINIYIFADTDCYIIRSVCKCNNEV